jgi:hypothetical protein
MPTTTIYFSPEEDIKIEELSKKWGIAKYQVVRRLVRESKEGEILNND